MVCRHILIKMKKNSPEFRLSNGVCKSTRIYLELEILNIFIKVFEVKIIAFCKYLLSLAPFSFKTFLKHSSEHDKNMICQCSSVFDLKTQNLTFSGVAMFWNSPKYSTFSMTFFTLVSLRKEVYSILFHYTCISYGIISKLCCLRKKKRNISCHFAITSPDH